MKFGQVMSTRRDLLPLDIANELASLQDRVPPFESAVAVAIIERAFGRPLDSIFASFEQTPVASASIAQVHFAVLPGGREVAVKVLRPNMLPAIEKDLALMHMMASWVDRLSADGKRLKPREVVAEFDKYLHDELDLVREAANAKVREVLAQLEVQTSEGQGKASASAATERFKEINDAHKRVKEYFYSADFSSNKVIVSLHQFNIPNTSLMFESGP